MGSKTINLGFIPRDYQREAHEKRGRFSVLVWHRRAGKTFFAVVELFLGALCCTLPMGEFGMIGPKFKQTKKNAWKYFKAFAKMIPGAVVNESECSVVMPHNGAKIRLYGADDPDSIRGDYFDGVVLDEVAQMKATVWGQVVRLMLADRKGWAIFIGTPKGINLFSRTYFKAITKPGWYADLRRWSDTNCLPAEEIADLRTELSQAEWDQEMECSFEAASAESLIGLDLAIKAQKRVVPLRDYHFAPKAVGVDVGLDGDDRSVIIGRQGLAAFRPRILTTDKPEVIGNHTLNLMNKWRPHAIFVDNTGGFGSGVISYLRMMDTDSEFNVIPVHFGSGATEPAYLNRRVEMWWKMRDWLREGGAIPGEAAAPNLLAELSAPKKHAKETDGKLRLEAKDIFKRRLGFSPDIADALALTFAAPVTKPDPYEEHRRKHQQQGQAHRVVTEFDPYADEKRI